MDKLFLLFLVCVFALSACNQSTDKQANVEINPEKVAIIQLDVEGMTCGGCEKSLERSIRKVPGIVSAKASQTDKTLLIEADTSLSSLELIKDR